MANEPSKYANLLNYLEREEATLKTKKKPKASKIIEEKKTDPKERVRELTKQMMEETEAFSFVPSNTKKRQPTEGFDVKLLEDQMIKKMIEDHKRLQSFERPYISVSEILKCLRACYYYRKKYSIDLKKKFTYPYLYIRRKVGDTVHGAIQDVYNFEEVEKSVISEKYHVKGRLDGLIRDCVIDFKPTENLRDEAEMKHYDQGNIYSTILNTEYEYTIKKVVIVYYLVNFKDVQVFVNDVDIKRGIKFLERGKLLKNHVESGNLIDPIGADEKECHYCPYYKYCIKDNFKEVAPPKAKITNRPKPEKIENEKSKKKKINKIKKRNKKFEYKDVDDRFLL
jgi:hypothetical protein